MNEGDSMITTVENYTPCSAWHSAEVFVQAFVFNVINYLKLRY